MPSSTPSAAPVASPLRATLSGAWRFALTAVGAFSVWAFAGRWFYEHLGEGALFAAIAAAFVVLAGITLAPLVPGPRRVLQVYRVFVPAFLAYAVVWSVSWFLLSYGLGEWLGALFGSMAFVGVAGWSLGNLRPFLAATGMFFATHTAGYFAGGAAMRLWFLSAAEGGLVDGVSRQTAANLGQLSWGLLYGLGFGAGLGYTFFVCRPRGMAAREPAP